MDRKKRYLFLAAAFLMALFVSACGKRKEASLGTAYKIYYVNKDNTGVLYYDYTTESTETKEVLQELIVQMELVPEKLEYNPPLSGNFALTDYSLSEGQLLLNFDENYKNQEIITEILVRAAIVRTLMQVKEIQYISFLVSSQPLTDASGNVVGVMNADNFIDNAGNEINTYERAVLRLYFADESGTELMPVSRARVYNSNISLERLVVEEMVAGPLDNDTRISGDSAAYPVINPDTKVISVNIRDGICYVDLDDTFLNQIFNATPEVTIYALANSLAELPSVNKVQISINGETNINYREYANLSATFERNLDLVGQK